MQKEFKTWLIENNYKPSTCEDYSTRIDRLCRTQKYTWDFLKKNIIQILPDYEKGGCNQSLGKRSHESVINALRNFQKFTTTSEIFVL